MLTDAASAELMKYAANCFLAMKLSYVNAMAELCERVGAERERPFAEAAAGGLTVFLDIRIRLLLDRRWISPASPGRSAWRQSRSAIPAS